MAKVIRVCSSNGIENGGFFMTENPMIKYSKQSHDGSKISLIFDPGKKTLIFLYLSTLISLLCLFGFIEADTLIRIVDMVLDKLGFGKLPP